MTSWLFYPIFSHRWVTSIFLAMVVRAGAPSARAELRYKYYRSILNMSPDGSSKQIQRRLYINFQAT